MEIAWKCLEHDRQKRPSIGDILEKLNETETLTRCVEDRLLEVQPLEELCFLPSIKRNTGVISCLLQLNNMANDRIAFMLVAKNPKWFLTKKPLCGIVPPRSAYTITLTMPKQPPSSASDNFFTLSSVLVSEHELRDVEEDSVIVEYDNFFEKAKRTAEDEVQEVKLKVICDGQAADQRESSSEVMS
jgi:coatomer subunit beta'